MAVTHDLAKLFALGRRQCIPRIESEVDSGLLKRQSRSADFLQLGVNRGPVRLVGGKQIPQVNLLHFKVGSAANLRLPEVGFLLANLCGLLGTHAKLFTHGRVAQQMPESKFAASHALLHAHPVAAPPHVASMAHPVLGAVIIGRQTGRVTLSENRGTTDHQCQCKKRSFRVS
jgi:hypothetical protein